MLTVRLAAGEAAVVGYGSLLLPASLSSFLRRPYEGSFTSCYVHGWRRSWNIGMPNKAFYFEEHGRRIYPERIIYLNVRPDPSARMMNCSVFTLSESDFAALRRVEWMYEAIPVADCLSGVEVVGGEAFLFVGRPDYVIDRHAVEPRHAAIRASYVKILDSVLAAADTRFRTDFARSSDMLPAHLVVDDHFDPDRPNPWEAVGLSYRPDDQVV